MSLLERGQRFPSLGLDHLCRQQLVPCHLVMLTCTFRPVAGRVGLPHRHRCCSFWGVSCAGRQRRDIRGSPSASEERCRVLGVSAAEATTINGASSSSSAHRCDSDGSPFCRRGRLRSTLLHRRYMGGMAAQGRFVGMSGGKRNAARDISP